MSRVKRIIEIMNGHPWRFSVLATGLFFLLFNIVATPLLNSGDDTYIMYTLAGGYGEGPTNLLQYNNIWHPVLGWVVSGLFDIAPGVNWYTVFLLSIHFAGLVCIFYVLLERMPFVTAIVFYVSLLLFIETRQLLSLTFTGAAIVAGTGALSLLVHQLSRNKIMSGNSFLALFVLLLAGLLRLEVAWLVLMLFVPVVITVLNRQQLIRYCVFIVAVVVMLFVMNRFHQQFYQRHIPGWKQQEQYRQNLFYAYNKQLKETIPAGAFTDSTEQALFGAGFLYDTTRFNEGKIKKISTQITRNRSITNKNDLNGLYWFFIEMRIYLLLFAAAVILLLLAGQRKAVYKWLLSLSAYIAIHVYLFVFMKITMPLHLGMLMILLVSLALQVNDLHSFITGKVKPLLATAFFLLLSLWMGYRIYKENEVNIDRKEKFACALSELNRNGDKLFIATDDYFPVNYIPIWQTPSQHPVHNLLYKDRLITFTYRKTTDRFGITNLDSAMVYDKRVFLLGKPLPALENGKYPAVLSAPITAFGCLQVRRLDPKP